jgi:hypothetical protein
VVTDNTVFCCCLKKAYDILNTAKVWNQGKAYRFCTVQEITVDINEVNANHQNTVCGQNVSFLSLKLGGA